MAVATSIDALAVGVSFAFLGIKSCSSILYPAGIIGFVSFFMSLIGLIFGIRFGCGIARKLRAELWGRNHTDPYWNENINRTLIF